LPASSGSRPQARSTKINNRLNQIKILIKLGFWAPVLFFSYIEIGVSRDEFAGDSLLQRRVYCEPGRPGPGGMASAAATLAVAGAALRLANPCGISGVAKPVAQQDRRSAPPDGRDRI